MVVGFYFVFGLSGQFAFSQAAFELSRHPCHATAGHITLHNQTASGTLAVNDIRSLLDLHCCQRPQRHMGAAWHGEERVADGLYISPRSFAKADHEVKHLALLVDLGHGHT